MLNHHTIQTSCISITEIWALNILMLYGGGSGGASGEGDCITVIIVVRVMAIIV